MRTVYATVLELRADDDVSAAIDHVGRWISEWYRRRRIDVEILDALDANDVEVRPLDGHRLSVKHHTASSIEGQSLVDIAWEYPDQYDGGLGWFTSLALMRKPDGLTLSLTVAVTGLTFQVAPASIRLGSPRLVRDIARLRSVFLGGRAYNVIPEVISADVVELLVDELVDVARPYPIVVVSRRTRDDSPLVDAYALADDLAGVAKVYELADKWAAFRLTEEIGRRLSCFDGAVRIYWPRFGPEADPFAHPLWTSMHLSDPGFAERSLRQVVLSVFDAASFRHVEPPDAIALRRASEREARQSQRVAAADAADTDRLLQDIYDLEDRLKAAEALNTELSRECETLRSNAMSLASGSAWAQSQPLTQATAAPGQPSQSTPETVEEAARTVARSARHLTFLPSAFDSAADSPFRHPDRVKQALEALDEVAAIWAKGLKTGGPVGSLRQLFKQRGFVYADDVSQTSKGKWGDEYRATFEGKDYDISPHITIGAKQADSCLSIHWAWDKERQSALVAHVGRHKTNTKT